MKKIIAIIGAGPAALMLAAKLDEKKFDVTIYEKNNAPGRKFLVAGQGGFNLTHSEPIEQFIKRYTPSSFFENLILSFSNTDLRKWFDSIGIPTIVGSSKRVFPVKGIKPIEVLNAILKELKNKKVTIMTQHPWQGWNSNDELLFNINEKTVSVKADIKIFALGGASWKITGSDGLWSHYFADRGVNIIPFEPSNCAFKIDWPKAFLLQAEGQPLKNISLKCDEKEKEGEIMITAFGIEGSAIYAMSQEIRNQLNEKQNASVFMDMKSSLSTAEIIKRLKSKPVKNSYSKHLQDQLKLSKVQVGLLKTFTNKKEYMEVQKIALKIKSFPLEITDMAPIDEAISTVGGISLSEIDKNFQLKKISNQYVIGEMLDWDAPTGGYLLQGCFSMGAQLARYLNEKIKD